MIKNQKHIAIIGAGISGLLAAYYLAKEGYIITIFDQEQYSGMQCSYANGGQIGVSNSETWHSWSNIIKGIKWLYKKDAPLLIRPSIDIDKAKWLIKFLLNTANNVREINTIKLIQMGLESRELYKQIASEEKIKFDFINSGILHFYKDKKYFEAAKQNQSLYEKNGCEWTILSAKQVLEREPTLKFEHDIVGGIWTENDWTGDIHKFCIELTKVLCEKYKVMFRNNNIITNQRLENLITLYDNVVIAAGVDSTKFARFFGDKCSIYPVKGYSITITPEKNVKLPTVSLLDDQAKIVTSTLGNRLRVAGTAELNGYNYDIIKDRITPLLNWTHNNFPQINTNNFSSWACLRPMTADMLPMIMKSKQKGVYYHTGHGHLGWTISPATAKQLVTLIQN